MATFVPDKFISGFAEIYRQSLSRLVQLVDYACLVYCLSTFHSRRRTFCFYHNSLLLLFPNPLYTDIFYPAYTHQHEANTRTLRQQRPTPLVPNHFAHQQQLALVLGPARGLEPEP